MEETLGIIGRKPCTVEKAFEATCPETTGWRKTRLLVVIWVPVTVIVLELAANFNSPDVESPKFTLLSPNNGLVWVKRPASVP
jgi:hypothetical protein